MTTKTTQGTVLLITFPHLHPDAGRTGTDQGVLSFDPGMQDEPPPCAWRPADLPLSPAMARAFLRESDRFALEHGRDKAKLSARALVGDDFYAQTSLAIRSRLTSQAGQPPPDAAQAVQAQQVLLLAWQLEQQFLEMRDMQRRIDADLDELGRILDPEGEAGDRLSAADPLLWEDESLGLPWRTILEALLLFTPAEAVLSTSDRTVLDALGDLDPGFEIHPDGFPEDLAAAVRHGRVRLFRAPGWRLAGRTRPAADKPWLEAFRTVLLAPPPAASSDAAAP